MRCLRVIGVAGAVAQCLASENTFSVNDDLFAFPQYNVEFANSYVLQADALEYLDWLPKNEPTEEHDGSQIRGKDVAASAGTGFDDSPEEGDSGPKLGSYEYLVLHGYPHLCFIPRVKSVANNGTTQEPSAEDREKELDQALSRGSQLLQGMASNQCLYYSTGWWTYSFCYDAQITQFHALPPGSNGRVWPPQEDPTTPSYVLGKFEAPRKPGDSTTSDSDSDHALSTEVKTKAETNYLVQRLQGGTPCDLTGNDRQIEVQFHCNPQLTDRIGWIKETATCAYLMIVYTPRLCNDVAFQPPKESRAHPITCREIVLEDGVADWEARHKADKPPETLLDQGPSSQQIVLGNIEVGAMKLVGREGRKLERGRIVLSQDERAETVIMQKNGEISGMSKAELQKLDLSPQDVEDFRKELQKLAGNKDWKIERLDDVNGHVQLRGVVATDDKDEKVVKDKQSDNTKSADPDEDEPEKGSQEEYADEL